MVADRHPYDILPARRPAPSRAPARFAVARLGLRVAAVAAPRTAWRRAAARELAAWRVGCAALDLTRSGIDLTDAAVPDLMELAGTDLTTTFAALDRLVARLDA